LSTPPLGADDSYAAQYAADLCQARTSPPAWLRKWGNEPPELVPAWLS